MAITTVQSIINEAAIVLNDVALVRWSQTELLGYLNGGQKELIKLVPAASVINEPYMLSPGKTKQSIPDDGIVLVDVVRNMGADGLTPGNAIRSTDRESLDTSNPAWHSAANTIGYIKHVTGNPADPKTFYCYPKAPDTPWHIEIIYSFYPGDAAINGVILVDDIYSGALLKYVLYRAFGKDDEAANGAMSAAYYQSFLVSCGVAVGGAK